MGARQSCRHLAARRVMVQATRSLAPVCAVAEQLPGTRPKPEPSIWGLAVSCLHLCSLSARCGFLVWMRGGASYKLACVDEAGGRGQWDGERRPRGALNGRGQRPTHCSTISLFHQLIIPPAPAHAVAREHSPPTLPGCCFAKAMATLALVNVVAPHHKSSHRRRRRLQNEAFTYPSCST